MKPVSYKRILAYLIDIILISFIGSLITYFIPVSEKYKDSLDSFYELMGDIRGQEIEQDEYFEKVNDLSYTLSRESVATTVIVILLSVGYYVIFVNNNDGQTLGKKIMKIKTVSANTKPLTMKNYFLRALFINSILADTISLILILVLSKSAYLRVNDILSTVFGCFYLVTFAMILFRNDGRGLHDIIAGSQVVAITNAVPTINEELEKKEVEEPEEAIIIKEEKAEPSKPASKNKRSKAKAKPKTSKKDQEPLNADA